MIGKDGKRQTNPNLTSEEVWQITQDELRSRGQLPPEFDPKASEPEGPPGPGDQKFIGPLVPVSVSSAPVVTPTFGPFIVGEPVFIFP